MCKSSQLYHDVGHSLEVHMYRYQESGVNMVLMMNPQNIVMEDISDDFFDTIMGMSHEAFQIARDCI